MLLDDAYQALGLKPPWDHEERIRDRHEAQFAKRVRMRTQGSYDRAIGSTQHMLIELYLDIERANRLVNPMSVGKIKFLVVVLNKTMSRQLQQKLAFLHEQLNLYVSLKQVQFIPYHMMESLRGKKFPSWGVFCDNSVKENILDLERANGPYRYIREIHPSPTMEDVFDCSDRDANLVCSVVKSEVNDILAVAECPITFTTAPLATSGYKPVSYPAWAKDEFLSSLIYRMPFQV